MKHVFKATKLGWEKEKEGIWFDSDDYTAQEARDEFKPYEGTTQRGYSQTGYEYDGQKYHDVTYLGEFEDDEVPHNDLELLDYRLRYFKKQYISGSDQKTIPSGPFAIEISQTLIALIVTVHIFASHYFDLIYFFSCYDL